MTNEERESIHERLRALATELGWEGFETHVGYSATAWIIAIGESNEFWDYDFAIARAAFPRGCFSLSQDSGNLLLYFRGDLTKEPDSDPDA